MVIPRETIDSRFRLACFVLLAERLHAVNFMRTSAIGYHRAFITALLNFISFSLRILYVHKYVHTNIYAPIAVHYICTPILYPTLKYVHYYMYTNNMYTNIMYANIMYTNPVKHNKIAIHDYHQGFDVVDVHVTWFILFFSLFLLFL